ncbi:MAG: nicotinate (nicotinamide) nucleotide adenylyltransferase [Ginsengibacter sp.]
MNIGLYFGSFNPIHTGHLIIANYLVSNSELDQLWFVITPQNPLKVSASLLNEYHRKFLIDIAIDGEKKLRTSTIEFSLPKPSYTIDTIAYLKEKHPGYVFTIILGSDSFKNIHNWKNNEVLIKNNPILVYPRPGFEVTIPPGRNVILADAPLLEISSTRIREMIKKRQSIKFWVPDVVKEEIERNHYYRLVR